MTEKGFLNTINEYCKKTGISTSNVVALFAMLQQPVESSKLVGSSYISKNALAIFKKDFSHMLMPTFNKLVLNSQNQQVANLAKKMVDKYSSFEPEQYGLNYEIIDLIMQSRQEPERSFDQFLCTQETLLNRVKILVNRFDLQGKKILLIGDDDFLSVALSTLGLADKITVLEIDKRIYQKINKMSKSLKLEIDIRLLDVKAKLPVELLNTYDVVFTDPPYTPNGVALFVSRAIQLLNFHNKSASIYFCYGNSEMGKERFVEIQEQITKMGLYLSTIYERFNQYTGADSIGNTSNLYVCQTTAKTKPVISGGCNEKIYTNN